MSPDQERERARWERWQYGEAYRRRREYYAAISAEALTREIVRQVREIARLRHRRMGAKIKALVHARFAEQRAARARELAKIAAGNPRDSLSLAGLPPIPKL